MSGWIKLHRQIQDNPMWLSEAFDKPRAWIDLMLIANHSPSFIRIAGQRVEVPRGGIGWSRDRLAKRWSWSKGKVERFLKELKNDQQIEFISGHRISIIRLCNYEEYQGDGSRYESPDESPDRSPDRPETGHQTGHQTGQEQECKERKNEKNVKKYTPPDWVPPEFWNAYLKSRRQKKHPTTPEALALCVEAIERTIAAGISLEEIMPRMIESGWRSCKAEWFRDRPLNGSSAAPDHAKNAQILANKLQGKTEPKVIN